MIYQSLSKKIPPIIGTLIRTISDNYYIIIGYHYQFSTIIITQNINHPPQNRLKQLLPSGKLTVRPWQLLGLED